MEPSLRRRIEEYVRSLPGKRGLDIPAAAFDAIHAHASAVTLPMWGRYPTPEHMAGFYEAGAHENPALIHGYYESQPHPHASSLTVGQYHGWADAHKSWQEHSK